MRRALALCLLMLGCRGGTAVSDAGRAPAEASAARAPDAADGGDDMIPAEDTPRRVVTSRGYRGTLGDGTKVEVTLSRDGDRAYGWLRHGGSARDDHSLRGRVGADEVFQLEERRTGNGEKQTGALELRPAPGGGLAGTWRDPSGAKSLPARLAPWGIAPASRDTFLDFCVRLTHLAKKPLSRAEIDRRLHGYETLRPAKGTFDEVLTQHGIIFSQGALYVSDVNNDGTPDFVLVDKNPVATHNDMMSVYDEDGDSLREVAMPSPLVDHGGIAAYRDSPFVEPTSKGIVMRWMNLHGVDANGEVVRMIDPCANLLHQHIVVLWRGSETTVLSDVKWLVPCG
jgi:hypothetical protein